MSRPRASVLLPVRDGPYLTEALASLSAQTFASFEVCLQLDGAGGAVDSTAEDASRADDRIRIERKPPRGIVSALNAAAARARAPLLVRMDADDVCTPDRLERLVALADARPDVALFASRVEYVSETPLSEGLLRYQAWLNRLLLHDEILENRFVECPMPHPAWAVRRETFDDLGGYRDGPFPEDYEFFLRAAEAGVRFEKVDRVLLHWRERPDRLSRRDPRYALRAFFELKARFLLPMLERDGRDVVIAGTGKAARRWCRRLREGGREVVAFLDPEHETSGRTLKDPRVVSIGEVPDAKDAMVLIAVGGEERDRCARTLRECGHTEGQDFFGVQ